MNCPKCGKELIENAVYCDNCSYKIEDELLYKKPEIPETNYQNNQTMYPQNQPQVPYMPNNQQMYPQQPMYYNKGNNINNKDYISPEDNKKANIICTIILGITLLLDPIGAYVFKDYPEIAAGLTLLIMATSLILLIYVRVKYPKNIFGKILMWLAIIGVIGFIIMLVLIVVGCVVILNSCGEL